MRRYGRSNGQAIMRGRRMAARAVESARREDDRDIGCRPEVERIFKSTDESGAEQEHDVNACMTFGCLHCLKFWSSPEVA